MGHRVAVIEYMHETNTFSVLSTDESHFLGGHYYAGEEIEPQFRNTNSELGGFISAVDRYKWTSVFTVAALAEPGGVVTESARQHLTQEIISRLCESGPYDGIFIAFHGSMVTETSQDGETQLLKRIREVIGTQIPIAVTLDLHANIFDEMAHYADIAVSYRSYPHIDMAERAEEACGLLERAMNNEIQPALEIARPAMLQGCDDGRTTQAGPMKSLLASAAREMNQDGILCVSINAGFTDADVEAAGPSVIVCYDKLSDRQSSAGSVAQNICDEIWRWRDAHTMPISLSKCLTQLDSRQHGEETLVIADFSDNPGSGSYGDCTAILKALLDRDVKNAAVGALWDPEAVAELARYGEGATVTVTIGGKIAASIGGGPITVTGNISSVGDGHFIFEGPMHRGMAGQLGMCACLTVGGVDILLVSERMQMLDKNIFRAAGIEPDKKSILVVKSMQHFRAAFEPGAGEVIVTDAGGLCTPDVKRRTYTKVRRPIFPLDNVSERDQVLS